MALRLRPPLAERLEAAGLTRLFDDLEMPLVEVLVELETNGIRIDTGLLARLSAQYGEVMQRVEREIYELAGREFNIGSPKQLGEVLFEDHKLPVLKRTKTGGSTDADVLEELARQHPLPAKILEYRQYAKLKSTYVDALPQLVHPETKRVHASFNQVVAATGRLSSHDPNLQNIPVRSQRGRDSRGVLAGRAGLETVGGRLFADRAARAGTLLAGSDAVRGVRARRRHSRPGGQRGLRRALSGSHQRHAAQRQGGEFRGHLWSESVRSGQAVEHRKVGGGGVYRRLFQPLSWRGEIPAQILDECPKTGYVSTILGRRRAIRGIRRVTSRQRNLPERTAINTVIQGSAADLIKLAMINIHRRLRSERSPARMLLQIHDELVFEVPADDLPALGQLVADEMSSVMDLSVPLRVDLKTGDNWAQCQD